MCCMTCPIPSPEKEARRSAPSTYCIEVGSHSMSAASNSSRHASAISLGGSSKATLRRLPTCFAVSSSLRPWSMSSSCSSFCSGEETGHQWSSGVISGHQWSSGVISGHQWSSVVFRGHQWLSVVFRGHQWSSGAISGSSHARTRRGPYRHLEEERPRPCRSCSASSSWPWTPWQSSSPGRS